MLDLILVDVPDSLLSVCSINKLLLTLHTTYDVSYLINTIDIVVFMVFYITNLLLHVFVLVAGEDDRVPNDGCKGTPFIPTNKSVKKHNKIVTAEYYI